jgi:hypothetical protein
MNVYICVVINFSLGRTTEHDVCEPAKRIRHKTLTIHIFTERDFKKTILDLKLISHFSRFVMRVNMGI